MSPSDFQVRRATLQDLPVLRQLWQADQFKGHELERRFTEFQVVATARGELLGAIGLHLENHQGLLHAEVYRQPEHEEALRPHLWQRIQNVARNHGLHRLWTREKSPFWRRCGLQSAGEADLARLPASFGDRNGEWLTLQLRDDLVSDRSVEQEFEVFKAEQEAAVRQALHRVRLLRFVALVVALAVLAIVGVGVWKFVKVYRPRQRRK